jgi:rubrerythrin
MIETSTSALKQPLWVCPRCGTEHSSTDRCPACAYPEGLEELERAEPGAGGSEKRP